MATDKNHIRSSIQWKKLRRQVLIESEFTCYYCGHEADQVDHVVSIKDEPSLALDRDNCVACCRRCNLLKGSKELDVFLRSRSTRPILQTSFSPTTIGIAIPGPMMANKEA